MKKLLIISLLFLTGCGYTSIEIGKNSLVKIQQSCPKSNVSAINWNLENNRMRVTCEDGSFNTFSPNLAP